jgi:SAM-dependent methyltransferase
MLSLTTLKNQSIYLAPKNNITEYFAIKLEQHNIHIKGYIDNFRNDHDTHKSQAIKSDDFVLIYSPNYWKEIAKDLATSHRYIIDHTLNLIPFSNFTHYIQPASLDVNSLPIQKLIWHRHLKEHIRQGGAITTYGYSWGDPENAQDPLGNYLHILNQLQQMINNQKTVLEIGTLSGKWTQYMFQAKKIICVDINNLFIDVIKERFPDQQHKLAFYISQGNELDGIASNSIDTIFCMDTLVRVEKQYIFDYIAEINRILTTRGEALIHLPNSDINECKERKFTTISTDEIEQEVKKYFTSYTLDHNTIIHGTLVHMKKE